MRALLLASLIAVSALASAPARAWDASGACTPAEKWTLPEQMPPVWAAAFQQLLDPAQRGDASYLAFRRLGGAIKGANAWTKAVGQYGASRALFKMGLFRFAFAEFEKVLDPTATAAARPLQRSAFECLNIIRKQGHPSLYPNARSLDALYRFPVAESNDAAELLVSSALQKLRLDANGDVTRELAALTPRADLAKMVQAVRFSRLKKDAEAIQLLEPLTTTLDKTGIVARARPMLQLLLARAYYHRRRFVEADRVYRSVDPAAAEFPTALSESAWAALQAGNYPSAINASLNFDTGPLRQTYSPESYLVAAIGLFEICRFPEARARVAEFLKIYGPEFAWLDQWSKVGDTRSPYGMLVSSLKKPIMPPKVQRELSSASAFGSYQGELNSLVDEQTRIDAYVRSYAKTRRPEYLALRQTLMNYRSSLPAYRQSLITWLDYEFKERLKRMHAQLVEIKENTDSVLVEVFNAAGEEMIADHSAGMPNHAERKISAVAPKGRGTKMVWATLPAQGQKADAEVWTDEIGGIEQDLSDRCEPAPGTKPAPAKK